MLCKPHRVAATLRSKLRKTPLTLSFVSVTAVREFPKRCAKRFGNRSLPRDREAPAWASPLCASACRKRVAQRNSLPRATARERTSNCESRVRRAMRYLNNQEVLSVANMNAEGVHHLQPRVDAR